MTDEPTNLPAQRTAVTGGGQVVALVPQSLEEAYRLANAMSLSGLTPNNIKSPEAVLVAIMAGAELGFPPFQSLQSFAVVGGRPSLYGTAIPALLMSHGFDLEEEFENESDDYPDNMCAICTVTRPNGKKVVRRFSVADAKTAKLWGKKTRDGNDTPWITNPKRMLQMRARGFAANDGAADVIRGLHLYEEMQDVPPQEDTKVETGTGMAARLAARAQDVDAAGFNVQTVTTTTEEARPTKPRAQRAGKRKDTSESVTDASGASAEETSGQQAQSEATDNGTADLATSGDEQSQGETSKSPATSDASPAVQPHHEVAAKAEEVLAKAAPPTVVVPGPKIEEGHPLPGETYHIASALNFKADDGKWDLFKDGEFFSRVGAKMGNRVYAEHAPKVETKPEPEAEKIVDAEFTESAGIDASDETVVVERGHAAPSEEYFLDEEDDENGLWPVYKDGVEIARGDADTHPDVLIYSEHAPKIAAPAPKADVDPFIAYHERIKAAESWDVIRGELAKFRKTPEFSEADPARQRAARLAAYTAGEALRVAGKDSVTIHTDPSFFVLYLLQADPKDVRFNFAKLVRSAAYQALNDDAKEGVCAQVDAVAGG